MNKHGIDEGSYHIVSVKNGYTFVFRTQQYGSMVYKTHYPTRAEAKAAMETHKSRGW